MAEPSRVRIYGTAPPTPELFLGRDEALRDLKDRLGVLPGGAARIDPASLKARRGAMSQENLARATNPTSPADPKVSVRTIQEIESGRTTNPRSDTVDFLAQALGCRPSDLLQRPTLRVLTAVRGWPGVGKTSVAAALAHDPEIAEAFADGVLWAHLGQPPKESAEPAQLLTWLLSKMRGWLYALGIDTSIVKTLEEAQVALRQHLQNRRVLFIVDDAWAAEHVQALKVHDAGCAILVTTRMTSVAEDLATPADVYVLKVLSEEHGLELLRQLAPDVVGKHPEESRELVKELECLPLALKVAGCLLHREVSRGWDINRLLKDLRSAVLRAPPPVNLVGQTTPTVLALLRRSTDVLDPKTRKRFALLGVVKEKPASFDLRFMRSQWSTKDPKPTADELLNRGLLEPAGNQRFQMHALLVALADSMLER
jgi:hypothetical protein